MGDRRVLGHGTFGRLGTKCWGGACFLLQRYFNAILLDLCSAAIDDDDAFLMMKGHRLLSGLASALNALKWPPILIPTGSGQTAMKGDGLKLAFTLRPYLKADGEDSELTRVLALNDEILASLLGAEIGSRLGFRSSGLLRMKQGPKEKNDEEWTHGKGQ